MSLNDLFTDSDFQTGTYTVTRYNAGSWSNGVFTAGSTSTLSVDAAVQPIPQGRKLVVGPEGQTANDLRSLWTSTELRATAGTPDSVSIGGETWKVFEVETWTGLGETHYCAFVARQAIP